MSKSKIRHLFDGIRHSLDGAIFSQNAIKHGFFAGQHRIGGKTYEVLTTFYAKQTQFLRSQKNVKSYNTRDYENKSNWTLGENKPNSNPIKPNFFKGQNERKHLLHRGL